MTNTDLSPRQSRRHRSTIPIVLGVTALAVTGAVAFGVNTARAMQTDTSATSVPGVRVLTVDIDEGHITVRRASGTDVEIRTTRNWRPGYEPTMGRTFANGVLTLTADCPSFNLGCEIVQEIAVPTGTAVEVRAVDGTITAEELTTSRFSAKAVAGVVNASFAQPPDDVRLETVSGAVRLALPPAEYRISGNAVVGAVRVAMPSVPTADRTVSVHTVTGAVDVVSR